MHTYIQKCIHNCLYPETIHWTCRPYNLIPESTLRVGVVRRTWTQGYKTDLAAFCSGIVKARVNTRGNVLNFQTTVLWFSLAKIIFWVMPLCTWVRTDCDAVLPSAEPVDFPYIYFNTIHKKNYPHTLSDQHPPPPAPYSLSTGDVTLCGWVSCSTDHTAIIFRVKQSHKTWISSNTVVTASNLTSYFKDSWLLKFSDFSWAFLNRNVFCDIPKKSDRLLPIPLHILCL
jgi:hypothetical protein